MRRSGMLFATGALACVVFSCGAAYAAQPTKRFDAPRTEFGQPDLQGVWNYSSDVPLERPKEFADKEYFTREDIQKLKETKARLTEQFSNVGVGAHSTAFFDFDGQVENLRTSLIMYPENGHLPKLVAGVVRVNGFQAIFNDIAGTQPVRFEAGGIGKAGPEERGLFERCLSAAAVPPYMAGSENNYLQIAQSKEYVVITSEHIHDARIIPLDGRPFLQDQLRSWLGESRGRWEGNTLVVVTKNFNDRTASFDGSGTAYHKVVTERFSRTSADTLQYEATIEDPATFQDKIVLSFPMAQSTARIFEFACHEGNYAMATMLSGARKQESDALKTKN